MSDTLKTWSIEKVTRLISNLLKKNQGTANVGKFMKVGNDGNLVPDTIPDPTNKADKVTNATAGNFAGLDATGNLTDSGKSAEDFAGAIYKTATPGSIVTFDDGADNLPIKELKVGIDPVQDLHGCDHPWPAGGGKNLAKVTDNTIVRNGVTITFANDEIRLNGTCTGNTWLTPSQSITLPAGTYTMSVEITGVTGTENRGAYGINKDGIGYLYVPNNGGKYTRTFTLESESTAWLDGYIYKGNVYNNAQIKFQIEKGSTATDYVPYSNICPISGWDEVDVNVSSVNAWDEEWELGVLSTTGGNATSSTEIRSKNYIPVVGGQTYYLYCAVSSTFNYRFYDADKNFISGAYIGRNNTLLIPNDARYMRFYMGAAYGATYNHDISINYPATDTEYEPYQGETYDITFPSEAGTVYGGTLDVTTGVLTVDMVKTVFAGVINDVINGYYMHMPSGWADGRFVLRMSKPHKSNGNNSTVNQWAISDKFKKASFNAINVVNAPQYSFAPQENWNTAIIIYVPNMTTVDNYLAWFAENPTEIAYKLATPITYQLTPQEIRTLLGVNNIWADTGDITELIYPVNTDTAMALYEKADKVANATAGNFAALDAEGNLKDSGKKPSDFLTQDQGATNAGKFMKVGADGKLVPDTIPDPTGKADKVSGATNGNFAGLDANGNLMDSGKSTDDFLDKNYESGWKPKTLSGLANIDALYVWTDGENIYYSKYGSHYVLDKTTFEWTRKVWNGYTDFSGKCIWSDGENIYYSSGGTTIVLDKSTSTWSIKYWNNFTYSLDGDYIWTDGENYYYSRGTAQYVLDKANDTWVTKTWNGLTNFDGVLVWTDGNDIYHTAGTTYVLDKATSTWSVKTWSGMAGFGGSGVWSDGENVYYNSTKVLDRDSSTWEDKSWNGLDEFYSENLWTDRENIYCSRNNSNYILDNNPKLYLGQDGEFAPVSVKKFIDDNVPAYSFAYDTVDSALVITIPN